MHGTAINRPDHLARAAFARRELVKRATAVVAGSVVGLTGGIGAAHLVDRSPSASTPVPASAAPPRRATGPGGP
jgi:hypothetical protein